MEKKVKPALLGFNRKHRSLSNSRRAFLLMMGLTMNSLLLNQADAADHIEIVREVLLESGHSAMAKQLAPTNDGGIVVAGSFSSWIPWATRVDAEGKVRWRYLMEMEQWQPGAGSAGYESAATLPDDSTVLSGFMSVSVPGRSARDVVGLLTHLDRAGKVISHQQLYPQGDDSFGGNYLRRSVPWGDGVVVIGETGRARKVADNYVLYRFFWLIALNATGEIKWEKLISNPGGGVLRGVAATPNHGLILLVGMPSIRVGSSYQSRVNAIRLGEKAEIETERIIPGDFLVAKSATTESKITLFPSAEDRELLTIGSDLDTIKQVAGKGDWITARAVARTPNGPLFLAGNVRGTHKAAIAWLDTDLRSTQTFVFQPEDASGWVADVLPIGKPGEFATVRHIAPDRGGGAALTFVKIK